MPPIRSLGSTTWNWSRCWTPSGASRLLHEPPDAEPHVRWCGRTAGVTPPPTRSNSFRSQLPANWSTLPQRMTNKDAQSMTDKLTTAKNDRRSRPRLPIRVPVKVRHQGHEHAGLARDLSSSGIFLYSESNIKAGSKLDLVIMLPPNLGLGPGGWTLCQASVVRI